MREHRLGADSAADRRGGVDLDDGQKRRDHGGRGERLRLVDGLLVGEAVGVAERARRGGSSWQDIAASAGLETMQAYIASAA